MKDIPPHTKTSSDNFDYQTLLPLVATMLIDSVSYSVIAPSLIFYIKQQGGSQHDYGITLASFSLAAFLTKPLLGRWSDQSGFRTPFLMTNILAALGGLLYFGAGAVSASATPSRAAVSFILLGRLLSGAGSANAALTFAYIAQAVPHDVLTQTSAILSMVRVFGITVGPVVSLLLDMVHVDVHLLGCHIHADPLNSVGLFIAIAYVMCAVVVYLSLENPPPPLDDFAKRRQPPKDDATGGFWSSLFRLEILVPIFATFVSQMNFQLIETTLAPVASDIFGWQTVTISAIFGFNSILVFLAVCAVFQLRSQGMTEITMMKIGCGLTIVGYSFINLFWRRGTTVFLFLLSFGVATMALPFLGSPTRSQYIKTIHASDNLRQHQGSLQALLSMMQDIPGFIGPQFITAFVLKTPFEMEQSTSLRELTNVGFLAPLLAVISLYGTSLIEPATTLNHHRESITEDEVDEYLALLGSSSSTKATSDAFVSNEFRYTTTFLDFSMLDDHLSTTRRGASSSSSSSPRKQVTRYTCDF